MEATARHRPKTTKLEDMYLVCAKCFHSLLSIFWGTEHFFTWLYNYLWKGLKPPTRYDFEAFLPHQLASSENETTVAETQKSMAVPPFKEIQIEGSSQGRAHSLSRAEPAAPAAPAHHSDHSHRRGARAARGSSTGAQKKSLVWKPKPSNSIGEAVDRARPFLFRRGGC